MADDSVGQFSSPCSSGVGPSQCHTMRSLPSTWPHSVSYSLKHRRDDLPGMPGLWHAPILRRTMRADRRTTYGETYVVLAWIREGGQSVAGIRPDRSAEQVLRPPGGQPPRACRTCCECLLHCPRTEEQAFRDVRVRHPLAQECQDLSRARDGSTRPRAESPARQIAVVCCLHRVCRTRCASSRTPGLLPRPRQWSGRDPTSPSWRTASRSPSLLQPGHDAIIVRLHVARSRLANCLANHCCGPEEPGGRDGSPLRAAMIPMRTGCRLRARGRRTPAPARGPPDSG